MKLTSYLRSYWKDNLIIGFITRKRAEELLMPCVPGTFLLRFSDSVIGSVSIAWKWEQNGMTGVSMLEPLSSKDFQARQFADRIKDIEQLTYLYPNIPKDNVFGQYYANSNINEQRNVNYKKWTLLARIEDNNRNEFEHIDSPNSNCSSSADQSPIHYTNMNEINRYEE